MGTQLKFRLHHEESGNRTVHVVGNIPELGQWVVLDGLELGWNRKHIWEETVTVKVRARQFIPLC